MIEQTRHFSCVINAQEAGEVQRASHDNGNCLVWTIYQNPSDHPEWFVARPHSPRSGRPLPYHLRAATLEEIRQLLPRGLYRMPAADCDDKVIVETWI